MSREAARLLENRRLDSWKEIATFFGRDERTVKRWEKTRALPVHRLPGNQRGGVFAYSEELTDWLNSAPAEKENSEGLADSPAAEGPKSVEPETPLKLEAEAELDEATPLPRQVQRWRAIAAVGVVLLIAITAFVMRQVRSHSSQVPPSAIGARPIHVRDAPDHMAVELYLKGRYYWNRRTGDSLNRAADFFKQAIALDPTYAEAYAGLADTYNLLREYTSMPESEAYPLAIAAANRAVALDDSLAEAHRALAFALFNWKWEIPEAFDQYRRAIQLDPGNADAHHWYATSFLALGLYKEALVEIERARALSPASRSILADRALILYFTGERAKATAALQEMEQGEPGFLSPARYLAIVYFEQRNYPDFLEQQMRSAIAAKNSSEAAIAAAAKQGWQTGGERGMLEALAGSQQQAFAKGQSSGYHLADTCMVLGRKKDAVHYLQAAFAAHDASVFTVPQGRFAKELKGEPGFHELTLRILSFTERKTGDPMLTQSN
jgi:tetratricopeptide (TPR) repeat protein